jgi:hypothetical protein
VQPSSSPLPAEMAAGVASTGGRMDPAETHSAQSSSPSAAALASYLQPQMRSTVEESPGVRADPEMHVVAEGLLGAGNSGFVAADEGGTSMLMAENEIGEGSESNTCVTPLLRSRFAGSAGKWRARARGAAN